jgi:hypothetical protein
MLFYLAWNLILCKEFWQDTVIPFPMPVISPSALSLPTEERGRLTETFT